MRLLMLFVVALVLSCAVVSPGFVPAAYAEGGAGGE
jgi:hypothetical protein